MKPQPLIAVRDVPASSRWYQAVLGLTSEHGGEEYDQLFHGGEMVMQLHLWEAHEHPHIGNPDTKPYGNGVVLWFQDSKIDTAYKRARDAKAKVLEPLNVNPNANHREFWLEDLEGYVVVVAGEYGDLGASR
jgi:catechol 2,3-dioxygenase-like lactoylglutathione lyase family enzyme